MSVFSTFPSEAVLTAARRHRRAVEVDRVATNPWPNSFVTRLEALALLPDLLSHDSATLTLERWCETHMASPARILAERVKRADKQGTSEQLQLLDVSTSDAVRYRRVRLRCGAYILSEAANWYVPARLTDDMNRQLDTTEIPFGRAVQASNFRRRILSAKLLWLPLPEGWETDAPMLGRSPAMLAIPDAVLEHRAVLTLPDGTPFSEVAETYRAIFWHSHHRRDLSFGLKIRSAMKLNRRRHPVPTRCASWSSAWVRRRSRSRRAIWR